MSLIFFPILVYVCSLIASFVLAIFLRRYLWKLCINKVAAFTIGAIVFLIASKLFSIIASLILSAISRSLGEAGQLLGILAFSYGDKLIYFVTITPTILACVVGYKYLSAKIISFNQIPEAEVVTNKSRLFLGLSTGISVLVLLWALFGSWGPLYGIVTVPVASNLPRLATSLHQPRLCLLMPVESFNAEYDYRAIGMQCLHDSQTQEEYYNRCDLIPTSVRASVRESKFSSFAVSPSMSPYQECVTHHAESLANDPASSLSQDAKANTCNEIQNLARRAACLLPYMNTSTWTTMCSSAISTLKKTDDDHNAKDAVIIGKCLDKQTINELDKNGTPMWFNYHILTGYNSYGISLVSNDILSWLQSIGLDPKITNSAGKNFLSYLLDSHPESDFGKTINGYEMYTFLDHGLGIDVFTQKDKAGLSSMDYIFTNGHLKVLDNIKGLYPDLKGYKPSAILVTDFLEKCHTGIGDMFPKFLGQRGTAYDECFHSDDESARQEFLKFGLLGVTAVTVRSNASDISSIGTVDDNDVKIWFAKYNDTTINKFTWSVVNNVPKSIQIFFSRDQLKDLEIFNAMRSSMSSPIVSISGRQFIGSTTFTYNSTSFHPTDAVRNTMATWLNGLNTMFGKRGYMTPIEEGGNGHIVFDPHTNFWYSPSISEKISEQTWQFFWTDDKTVSVVEVEADVDPVPIHQCPIDQKNNMETCNVNIGFHFEFFISNPISLDKLK